MARKFKCRVFVCAMTLLFPVSLFFGCSWDKSHDSVNHFLSRMSNNKMQKFIELEPKKFENAPVRGSAISDCSPVLPDDRIWTGIMIQAPHLVRVLSDIPADLSTKYAYEVPLCGGLNVYVPQEPDPVGKRLELTDMSTHQTTFHKLKRSPIPGIKVINLEQPDIPPGYELNPELENVDKQDLMVQTYFNFNLADYISLSEIKEARKYKIRVLLREHRSNELEIEVSRKKE